MPAMCDPYEGWFDKSGSLFTKESQVLQYFEYRRNDGECSKMLFKKINAN